MLENFFFGLFLIILNLVLVVRRVPIFAIPLGIFTFFIGAWSILPDTNVPYQPVFTLFILFCAVISVLANAMELGEK